MNRLPEPTARQPHAPQPGQPINPDAQAFLADIEDALAAATKPAPTHPTSFRNDALPSTPGIGTTPPVDQPDTRRVPNWATGIAVASIGIGAGAVGLGCAVWLAAKGLAAITLTGVLAALSPFAGIALVVLTVGAAVAKANRSSTTNVYKGPVVVTSKTEVHSTARGMFARNRNQLPK